MMENGLVSLSSVESVRELEAALADLPPVDLQSQTLVHGRMAARAIFIPAGTLLTGVLTNIDNISVMVGDITVTTDSGPVRLTGFHVLPAAAGFKRAGIAHADTWWATLHHTDLTDIAEIEEEMTDEPEALQTRRLAAEFQEALQCFSREKPMNEAVEKARKAWADAPLHVRMMAAEYVDPLVAAMLDIAARVDRLERLYEELNLRLAYMGEKHGQP